MLKFLWNTVQVETQLLGGLIVNANELVVFEVAGKK